VALERLVHLAHDAGELELQGVPLLQQPDILLGQLLTPVVLYIASGIPNKKRERGQKAGRNCSEMKIFPNYLKCYSKPSLGRDCVGYLKSLDPPPPPLGAHATGTVTQCCGSGSGSRFLGVPGPGSGLGFAIWTQQGKNDPQK
jgi:hypothetical protein